ncbi:MAG: DEAD/DEAH box helicase family protein [Candidatus Hodarchaeota archaeon]
MSLYEYQKSAIEAWKNAENVGMLSMATGTGKTFTALFAIEQLLDQGNPVLILVPSKLLLDQWKEAITKIYPDVPVLMAGGRYSWKKNRNKRMFISRMKLSRIILSTMDTAISTDFMEFFSQAQNPVLVADEAHRLGSEGHREILSLDFSARLGLSATPERLFDEKGSQILEASFGGTPVFTLDIGQSVKLREGDPNDVPILGYFLSPYDYYFYPVELSKREQTEWDRITNEVKHTVAMIMSREGEEGLRANVHLGLLLIERARIVKKAENKVEIVNQIVAEKYPSTGKWIVYCEDEEQLDLVAASLRNSNQDTVILEYHSKMEKEKRNRALEYFKDNPSIIVSIRCLDEGVDIPSADGAIILASSSNPRQYIQRRGRVLRKAGDKKSATIIDVVVLPKSDEKEIPFSIIKGELGRAWNFAENARNRDITHELWKLCVKYGVNPNIDPQLGMEE